MTIFHQRIDIGFQKCYYVGYTNATNPVTEKGIRDCGGVPNCGMVGREFE